MALEAGAVRSSRSGTCKCAWWRNIPALHQVRASSGSEGRSGGRVPSAPEGRDGEGRHRISLCGIFVSYLMPCCSMRCAQSRGQCSHKTC